MITPYKQRRLDRYEPIEVYRNLNKKGVTYSIRQDGVVVGHATELSLKDVEFVVKDSGRKRARKSKRRNVHAWIRGTLSNYAEARVGKKMVRVTYNPFKYKGFVNVKSRKLVNKAESVVIYSEGVLACLK